MDINNFEIPKMEFDFHKRQCEELRKVRVAMAKTLGVPEVVRNEPCNYVGECQGTCPACYMEEKALMDRIYELSQNGVAFTLKEDEFEQEQEIRKPAHTPPKVYNPPVPPKLPDYPRAPILQGMIRPMPPIPHIEPPKPAPEPQIRKRGIFDKIKRDK